jgi:hypothetical protein
MRRSSLIFLPFMLVSTSLLAAPADVKVDVLQNKLDHPWSLAFLPQNQGMLITLKGGQLKRWQAGKGLSDPIVGIPRAPCYLGSHTTGTHVSVTGVSPSTPPLPKGFTYTRTFHCVLTRQYTIKPIAAKIAPPTI